MSNSSAVPGMCPYYIPERNVCYLSESVPDPGHRDYSCKSKDNCTRCGNYEAKLSGRNYTNK
jgi:hypothetical protein